MQSIWVANHLKIISDNHNVTECIYFANLTHDRSVTLSICNDVMAIEYCYMSDTLCCSMQRIYFRSKKISINTVMKSLCVEGLKKNYVSRIQCIKFITYIMRVCACFCTHVCAHDTQLHIHYA